MWEAAPCLQPHHSSCAPAVWAVGPPARTAPEKVKQRLLRECGVFIQHSHVDPETGDEESLPASIQEAMAHGLAVVSTRHAGIPEAVRDGETGLLVEEGVAKAMTAGFLRIPLEPRRSVVLDIGRSEELQLGGRETTAAGMARSEFVNAVRLRRLASLLRKERFCPFCGWRGFRFEPFGNAPTYRQDAQCLICGSLERHRLAFVLLQNRIARGQRVFMSRLKRRSFRGSSPYRQNI